jgi:pyridoxal 5'-phosphate synthase pdxT subunit
MMVGILALQGDFREHEEILRRIGVATRQVRQPKHLAEVDRLIIPGGESTTIGTLMVIDNLLEPIRERALHGMPLWGTCAGAILMANRIAEGRPAGQPALALMDITARRNAFGSQLDSFEADLAISGFDQPPVHAVFIRAPILEQPGPHVQVLATLASGEIVAAQQAKLLATCFRMHRLFLEL